LIEEKFVEILYVTQQGIMRGTDPPDKTKKEIKNACHKNRGQTYEYARNTNEGQSAWAKPRKKE
jgi:hypothetical protein